MALSVKSALSESPRPLAGMPPYGDRTFLPRRPALTGEAKFAGATARTADPNFSLAVRMGFMRITLIAVCFVTCAFAAESDWSFYGGDAGGTRYSGLKQITRQNVPPASPP